MRANRLSKEGSINNYSSFHHSIIPSFHHSIIPSCHHSSAISHEISMKPCSEADERKQRIAAAYDPQLLELAGRRMAALIAEHLRIVQSGKGPVLNWAEPAAQVALAKESMLLADREDRFFSLEEPSLLVDRFEELVKRSLDRGMNLHHPHYIGHQVPASMPLAALFQAVGTLTNQVMAIYEMGPWATAVERAVIETMGQAIGFQPGRFGGLVTSGGSLANLTALLTARNVCLGESWSQGLGSQKKRPVLVVHADAHYSVTRAAGILGLGAEQVVRVPLDRMRRMETARLDTILADMRKEGVPIVAVSAAACATPIGAFDRLEAVADVCQRHEVWLHVDAAHGGAACLSDRYRHLLAGLERADSVVCDAHKMMFIPALCAMVFYRDKANRFKTFHQEAPYLFDSATARMAEYDSGMVNLECTKHAAALGVWGAWSVFGRELFAALVETTFDLGGSLYDLLAGQDDFEPYCRPQCNIVVFRYLPAAIRGLAPEQIDQFQSQLRLAVIQSGDYYLVPSLLDGRHYLRTTIINPLTTEEHLLGLLGSLRKHGRRLLESE
jgi:L-2,4-diaminobutyrate decarboxylase